MRDRNPRKRGVSATRHQHDTRRPFIAELKAAAMERWADIFHDAAGIAPELLDGRGHPCPLCGGHDRFVAFKDVAQRGSVQCRSCFNLGTDPRPGDGIATLRWLMGCDTATACKWLAGWLGFANTVAAPKPPPLRRYVRMRAPATNDGRFDRLADRYHQAMKSDWWAKLESALSLPAAELIRLRVGWSSEHNATTWPMVDHDNNVVGIRTRNMTNGDKRSITGGTAGVFMPERLSTGSDRLFIAEGPTDTAAMLSIGFDCIGRPSCSGAVAITTKLVKKLRPAEVVIVADDDANGAGRRGAESLAVVMVTVCPQVQIIYPPDGINDAREWVRDGATADEVLAVVNAARVRSLTMRKGAAQ